LKAFKIIKVRSDRLIAPLVISCPLRTIDRRYSDLLLCSGGGGGDDDDDVCGSQRVVAISDSLTGDVYPMLLNQELV
jgi:hypothetical protein